MEKEKTKIHKRVQVEQLVAEICNEIKSSQQLMSNCNAGLI